MCPFPQRVAAGQRLKYEQYFDHWRENAYQITVSSFMDMDMWKVVYTPRNYGAKVFIKYNDYHKMVINIPTGESGEFVENPSISNLIGIDNIIATLPKILSNRYEGALLPIELANGIASLSTYPSAKALELFAEALIKH